VKPTGEPRRSSARQRHRLRHPPPAAQLVHWVVKASKLCNLRCRYCYEWNELGNHARLSLDGWERLLLMIREYHQRRVAELQAPFQSCIAWHGGEPLLLPLAYYERVVHLQHRILGDDALTSGEFFNAVQTNLYTLPDDTLDLFEREGFQIGVSMDVVGGVRLSAGGAETEDRVVENMDRLRQRGISFGAILVLAAHTSPNITVAYDFYESIGINFRVLPLFAAPLNKSGASFAVTARQMIEALCRLFTHWALRPNRVPVSPLNSYVRTVYLKMMGHSQGCYDRRAGEWAMLVNTDGELYQVRDAYQPRFSLGNVLRDSLDDVLCSDAYATSLGRDDALFERHCGRCEFRGACDSLPLFESPYPGPHPERCHIAYEVLRYIEAFVKSNGYTPERLRSLADEHALQPA
jgi:uncharacterized protein